MVTKKSSETLRKFGGHLSILRKAQKLSFRKMALKCDIDFSDIKKYELGKTNLSLLSIEELAKGLQTTIIELLDFDFLYKEDRLTQLIKENKAIKLPRQPRQRKSSI